MVHQKNEADMIEVEFELPRKKFTLSIKEQFGNGITGIFGPSGSGKTSLLHVISGLEIPESGLVKVGGRVLYDAQRRINVPIEKRNIGYVFQDGRLFPHMTIEKNLTYGLKKKRPTDIQFDEVVEMLNIQHLLKSKPGHISGGERQRAALGRALLSSPDMLLLDEPFSAVDIQLRSQILPFLLRIQQSVQVPILVVSHDLPDLLKLTDVLCIIKEGKCLGHNTYYELMKSTEVADIFSSGVIINSISMRVCAIKPETGLTILSKNGDHNNVTIKCEKSKDAYVQGQSVKIFINADDIALSTEKLETITIQNQLEGQISDIIDRKATILCIVNVGFRLVVEITAESQRRMKLSVGSKVWCLFKSVAIDVAG